MPKFKTHHTPTQKSPITQNYNNFQQPPTYQQQNNPNFQNKCSTKKQNSPYKKWSLWIIIILLIILPFGLEIGIKSFMQTKEPSTTTVLKKKNKSAIHSQKRSTKSSDKNILSASSNTNDNQDKNPKVPLEYTNALEKAKDYSNMMHMSKRGIYDQLVSKDGDKFTAEAAQYAIDNLQADYNANALAKAKEYQKEMHMSTTDIKEQLTSEDGEKFTVEQAEYAIQNLTK